MGYISSYIVLVMGRSANVYFTRIGRPCFVLAPDSGCDDALGKVLSGNGQKRASPLPQSAATRLSLDAQDPRKQRTFSELEVDRVIASFFR